MRLTEFVTDTCLLIVEAPYITGPRQRDIEQHTEIKLECVLPAGVSDVSWYRGTTQVNASAGTTIQLISTPDPHKSVLTIEEAEESDSGTYKCQSAGGTSNTTQVTVTESQRKDSQSNLLTTAESKTTPNFYELEQDVAGLDCAVRLVAVWIMSG